MKYGLEDRVITQIQSIFTQFAQIEKVVLYGSRAKGTYKNGSDIDLCLFGKQLDRTLLYKVEDLLDDLYLPYSFDFSIYEDIENQDLKDHINREGIVFYKK